MFVVCCVGCWLLVVCCVGCWLLVVCCLLCCLVGCWFGVCVDFVVCCLFVSFTATVKIKNDSIGDFVVLAYACVGLVFVFMLICLC